MVDSTEGTPGHPGSTRTKDSSTVVAPSAVAPRPLAPVNKITDVIVSLADYAASHVRLPDMPTNNGVDLDISDRRPRDLQLRDPQHAVDEHDCTLLLSCADALESTQALFDAPHQERQTATIISFDRDRQFLASIEIDAMTDIRMQFSSIAIEKIISDVGRLLRREFGTAQVRRDKRIFCVVHDDFEKLVAGVLRVQFHTQRLKLPDYNIFGEKTELPGITLIWGVGHNSQQADSERLKKKRQKRRQKTHLRSHSIPLR